MKFIVAGLATMLALVFCLEAPRAGDKKPKYSIEDVMDKAHNKKTGLLHKVVAGKASEKERKELVELYVALSQNKPPKGSQADWKERTTAMVKGAKAAVADAKKGKALAKIVKCMACHDLHKDE